MEGFGSGTPRCGETVEESIASLNIPHDRARVSVGFEATRRLARVEVATRVPCHTRKQSGPSEQVAEAIGKVLGLGLGCWQGPRARARLLARS